MTMTTMNDDDDDDDGDEDDDGFVDDVLAWRGTLTSERFFHLIQVALVGH